MKSNHPKQMKLLLTPCKCQSASFCQFCHIHAGKKVGDTIAELGGTMPEDLPTPLKGIKQIEKERKVTQNEQKTSIGVLIT